MLGEFVAQWCQRREDDDGREGREDGEEVVAGAHRHAHCRYEPDARCRRETDGGVFGVEYRAGAEETHARHHLPRDLRCTSFIRFEQGEAADGEDE